MSTACMIVETTQLLASAFEGDMHVNSLHDALSLWLGLGNCTVSCHPLHCNTALHFAAYSCADCFTPKHATAGESTSLARGYIRPSNTCKNMQIVHAARRVFQHIHSCSMTQHDMINVAVNVFTCNWILKQLDATHISASLTRQTIAVAFEAEQIDFKAFMVNLKTVSHTMLSNMRHRLYSRLAESRGLKPCCC